MTVERYPRVLVTDCCGAEATRLPGFFIPGIPDSFLAKNPCLLMKERLPPIVSETICGERIRECPARPRKTTG